MFRLFHSARRAFFVFTMWLHLNEIIRNAVVIRNYSCKFSQRWWGNLLCQSAWENHGNSWLTSTKTQVSTERKIPSRARVSGSHCNSYHFIELKPKITCIMTNYNIKRLTHLTRHWTQCLINCAWVTGTVRQTSEPVLTNEAQCCSDQKHFQGLSSSVLQRIIKRREVLGTTVGCPQVTSKGKKKNLNRKMYNKTTNRMLLWYTSVKEVVCFLLRMHYCCASLNPYRVSEWDIHIQSSKKTCY